MIKLDPRTRIIIVVVISSVAILVKEIKPLSVLLLLTLFLCKLFSISLLSLIRRLKRLLIFFVFLALIQSIFTPGGENLVKIGSLKILTIEGLYTGISIMLRMSTIICSAMLIASIPPMDLIYGLIAMRLPYELAFMVLLAIKFLPLFKEEFTDSIIAVQLAGTDLIKIPLGEKLLLYNYILTPSVLKALNRARYISISMEYRGFRAYSDRTSYRKLKMKKADYMTILATIVLAIGIITF